jgi:tetratricopeptide (TPR) repeat protein
MRFKTFSLRYAAWSLVLAAAAAGGTAWWRGRPERHLREAQRWLDEGSTERAAPWLELPERISATRDRARILRARIALAGGRPRDAVAPLQQVDPLGPWAAEAAFWKGRTLYAVGNTPLAIAWLRTALADRPTDAETLRWLAAAAYDLGDRRTVLESLQAVTSLEPSDTRAWRTLALVTQEEPDGGVPELDAARSAYEKALALDPDQPQVRMELAGVLVKLGQYDQAEHQLALCRGRVPEADRADLLAQSAFARGESDRCHAIVDAGLAAAPNHPGLRARRALIAQSQGQLDAAVADFDRAVIADPYNARWLYMRSGALRSLGRRDEADRDGARAAELKRAVITMSNLCAEAAQKPLDPAVRIQLGRLCEFLGKRELAASWYRAAMACDPRSEEARSALLLLAPR